MVFGLVGLEELGQVSSIRVRACRADRLLDLPLVCEALYQQASEYKSSSPDLLSALSRANPGTRIRLM